MARDGINSDEVWFERRRSGVGPLRLRLICLPHAGGTAAAYRGWSSLLPPDIEVLTVRYPGRQERFGEPCIESMDDLADSVIAALRPFLGTPLALFGHSMGAAVAYEIAARLQMRHGVRADLVAVSGRVAPQHVPASTIHLQDDETLVAEVRRMGGRHSAVFDHRELWELVLPPLRADYRLIENYRPEPLVQLRSPLVAYAGVGDPSFQEAGMRAWAELTTGQFELQVFPGDHFYLVPQEVALTQHLSQRLSRVGFTV
jgi:surfactin synthase thioesterase subunit